MLKKSLLSLAITATVAGLSGCDISSTTANDGALSESQKINEATAAAREGRVAPLFDVLNSVVPLGSDLVFASAATSDGTANVGGDGTNPVFNAINDLDGGLSTIAPIDIVLDGSVKPSSLAGNVFLVKLPNKADAASDATANLVLPLIELDENGDLVGTYNAASALDTGHTSVQMTSAHIDALDVATIAPLFSTLKADGTVADDSAFAAAAAISFAEGIVLPESVAALNLYGFNDGLPAAVNSIADGILAMQPVENVNYKLSAITLNGVADNTIRITPITPLDAKSKYITVVTKDVLDTNDQPLLESVAYEYISGESTVFSSSLSPVQAALQAWEGLAGAVLGTEVASGIAIASAHTTVDPQTLLKSMAYPGYWAEDAVINGSDAVAGALMTQAGYTADQIAALTAGDILHSSAAAVVSGSLTSDLGAGIAYENPRARSFELIENVVFNETYTGDRIPFYALSPTAETIALGGQKVWISQGAIQLPQYLTSLATNSQSAWEANTLVSAALDIDTPTDLDGETTVTYRYPFAQEQRTITAPLLFIEPISATDAATYAALGAADSACGDKPAAGWPVIIFQHGITTNRATSLLAGTSLAVNTCSVVVAMDLTHHGVAPQAGNSDGVLEDNSLVAFTVDANDFTTYAPWATAANTQSATDGSILGDLAERHESLYTVGGVTTPMSYEAGSLAGDSGDFFIRLDNFQRSRDNQGQSVMDLLNLNATLSTLNIDGIDGADLDTDSVSLVGHSLGAMIGTVFTAVNNDATVQAGNTSLPFIDELVVATPGGGTPKFLETSVSFGSTIKAGLLAAAGIGPGDGDFESFMQIMQATLDPIDPLNFVPVLATGGSSATPTLVFEMVGGAAIVAGSADHSDTAGMPTAFYTDATATTGVYPSDLTIPNNNESSPFAATSAYNTAFTPDETAQVELTGTDAYVKFLGAEKITATTGNTQTATHLVSKLTSGVHGTFSSANGTASFTEMMTEAAYFIGNSGTEVIVGNDAVIDTTVE